MSLPQGREGRRAGLRPDGPGRIRMDGTPRVTLADGGGGGWGAQGQAGIRDSASAPPAARGPRRPPLGQGGSGTCKGRASRPPPTCLTRRARSVTSDHRPGPGRREATVCRGRGGFPEGQAPAVPSSLPPGRAACHLQARAALLTCHHLRACAQRPAGFRGGRAPPGDCPRLGPGTSAQRGQPARRRPPGEAWPGPAHRCTPGCSGSPSG